jgi:hypothetical protein
VLGLLGLIPGMPNVAFLAWPALRSAGVVGPAQQARAEAATDADRGRRRRRPNAETANCPGTTCAGRS